MRAENNNYLKNNLYYGAKTTNAKALQTIEIINERDLICSDKSRNKKIYTVVANLTDEGGNLTKVKIHNLNQNELSFEVINEIIINQKKRILTLIPTQKTFADFIKDKKTGELKQATLDVFC